MKALIIGVSLLIIFATSSALARDYHRGGYYGDHHGSHHGYNRHHYNGHYRNRNHHGEYLIGGLILGSLISHSYRERRSYPRHTYSRSYNNNPYYQDGYSRVIRTTNTPIVTGRRLFKDIDGNCFERRQDTNGDELLEALPIEECAW